MHFVDQILGLQSILSFIPAADLRAAAHHEGFNAVSLQLVARALESRWWWGYCHVLFASNGAVLELQHTLFGCKCHPIQDLDVLGSRSYFQRRRAFERETGSKKLCPWRGRWSSDLACGLVQKMAKHCLDLFSRHILQYLVGCDAASRLQLLDTWASARAHIEYVLEMKFAFWQQLPWILCGIGNTDHEMAKQAAARSLDLWRRTAHLDVCHEELVVCINLNFNECNSEV